MPELVTEIMQAGWIFYRNGPVNYTEFAVAYPNLHLNHLVCCCTGRTLSLKNTFKTIGKVMKLTVQDRRLLIRFHLVTVRDVTDSVLSGV